MGIFRVIRQRKDGSWTLTDEARDYIYPRLEKRDGEVCNDCGKSRSTKSRLAIDHIDNVKPLKHELDGQIVLSYYQLLCLSWNTKKRREFEKNGLSNGLSQDYQNTSNTRKIADLNSTYTHKHTQIDSKTVAKNSKTIFHEGLKYIVENYPGISISDCITWTQQYIFTQTEEKESVSKVSAQEYFDQALAPKEIGGFMKQQMGKYICNEMQPLLDARIT